MFVFDIRVKLDSLDVMENIRKFFCEVVRKRFMVDRRIGCLFFGGLDFSLVVFYLIKFVKESGIDYSI